MGHPGHCASVTCHIYEVLILSEMEDGERIHRNSHGFWPALNVVTFNSFVKMGTGLSNLKYVPLFRTVLQQAAINNVGHSVVLLESTIVMGRGLSGCLHVIFNEVAPLVLNALNSGKHDCHIISFLFRKII
jgi:hypothetical protein